MGTNQFRSYVWDPVMILGQIVTIQCIFYFSLGVWVSASDFVIDSPRSLDQIFLSKVSERVSESVSENAETLVAPRYVRLSP